MIEEKIFVSTNLIYNYLVDLKKKEINPVDRANIIKEYMQTQRIGIRGLSRELGMPASTLQEWINYGKITKEEYADYQEQGLNETMIREIVTKTEKPQQPNELNQELLEIHNKLSKLYKKPSYDKKTLTIIKHIEEKIKMIKLYIVLNEKREKGNKDD